MLNYDQNLIYEKDGMFLISFLRALRALRALRPLRMVSRNEGLKVVVSSVFRSIPAIFNALLVTLLFYIIFGILGVIFFKGKFYYCNDLSPKLETMEDCKGLFFDEIDNI